MRSHVDRYATAGVARAREAVGLEGIKSSTPELTQLLYTRHNLEAALESIRYITMHVVKENQVREVSFVGFFICKTKSQITTKTVNLEKLRIHYPELAYICVSP